MSKYKIAVLGAGNGGLTFAGDLALAGHTVNLWEPPQFKENIEPIQKAGHIEMRGVAREGLARLNLVTTDANEALDGVKVIIAATPAYGHVAFAEAIAPHLQEGQMVILNPSYGLGQVEFANTLKKKGANLKKVLLGATGILPYATRKYMGYKVFCWRVKAKIPFSAFPATNTAKMLPVLNEIYAQDDGERGILVDSINDLKMSLETINLFAHPPMMILNAVDCELGEEPELKSEDSHAVRMLSRAMNREAMAITKSFGLEPWPNEYVESVMMYPYWINRPRQVDKPEWAKPENQPTEYAAGRGFNFLKGRYLTEDIPYGLVPISQLGDMVGVSTPCIDGVIDIGSVISEADYRKTGRTLEKLGLAGMNKTELVNYVTYGDAKAS